MCHCALDEIIFSIRRVKAIYRGLASLLISVTNVAETSFGLTNAKMIGWKLENLLDFLLSMSVPIQLLIGEHHEKITIVFVHICIHIW